MSRRRDTGKMQEKQATGVFLEMLIVVVILGLLAAIAMPHVSQLFGKGKAEAWEAELHNIQTATVAMLFDSGTGTLVPVGPTARAQWIWSDSIRQLPYDVGRDNVLYVHVTLVPYLSTAGEIKTKPTQHSVNKLREIGIQPHILLCRTDRYLPPELKEKIALFCNLQKEEVITAKDVETPYEVPLVFHKEGLDDLIVNHLHLQLKEPDLRQWDSLVQRIKHPQHEVTIALVGKYIGLKESYKSLTEALVHGGIDSETRANIQWVESDDIERRGPDRVLAGVDGIIVPGGFGNRGIEGKIQAIRHAREKQVPFLGLCLGMQCAVIEFARNVAGLKDANSSEFVPEGSTSVIDLMSDQRTVEDKGGTMRLGSYPCALEKGSRAHEAYGATEIRERHRHRYEFNNVYRDRLTSTIPGSWPRNSIPSSIHARAGRIPCSRDSSRPRSGTRSGGDPAHAGGRHRRG